MILSIMEWFWRLLPDKCQVPECCRKGVRGNENVILQATLTDDHGRILKIRKLIVCDYCTSLFMRAEKTRIIMTQRLGHVLEEPDATVRVQSD